ncbi:DMT family transporter [Scytonema sp. PCC 10023]|uniref:DMT family transporter n=1 Tax=Scytonema sp. PCC 10023 TaxID=1680591 RepID=UPI0039C6B418
MQTENFLRVKGIISLIFINLIGATTFPLTKDIVSSMNPSGLIATRFLLAAGVFIIHLRNLNALLLRDGMVLGLLFFFYLTTETIALKTIPANRAVFIVSLSALIVPLLGWLSGQRVLLKTFLAAGVAALGIGIMFWEGGELGMGDLLMFGGAVLYALYTLFLEKVTLRHPTLSLTSIQLLFIGGLGALWSNSQVLTQFEAISQHWKPILYLALFATAAVIWLQTLAQRWVSASEAALIYTIEPVFSAIFSFWLLGEHLGIRGLIGGFFVLAALFLNQSQNKDEPDTEVEVQSN